MAITSYREVTNADPGLLITDSLAADSAVSSVDMSGLELSKGIILTPPPKAEQVLAPRQSNAVSWVLTGLILVFVVICLRYRKNSRFFANLLHDITENRERSNAFDDTVRETMSIWLLNILWCASAGTLLYGFLCNADLLTLNASRLGICIGMAAGYTLFLTMAYSMVGNIFSDSGKASLWVRGYLTTQGLEGIVIFPLAVVGLCVPTIMTSLILLAAFFFVIAKLLFIYKGFCIFFAKPAFWMHFLYYLCSLEIVPIVLTYATARFLC